MQRRFHGHQRDELVFDQLIPDLGGTIADRFSLLVDLGTHADEARVGGVCRLLELHELRVNRRHLGHVLVSNRRDLIACLQRHHDRLARDLEALDERERSLARLDHTRAADERDQIQADLRQIQRALPRRERAARPGVHHLIDGLRRVVRDRRRQQDRDGRRQEDHDQRGADVDDRVDERIEDDLLRVFPLRASIELEAHRLARGLRARIVQLLGEY